MGLGKLVMLAVSATGPGGVHFSHPSVFQLVYGLTNRFAIGLETLNSLGIKRFYCPSTDSATDDGVDLVMGQLVHRVTRPVIVMSIAIGNCLN